MPDDRNFAELLQVSGSPDHADRLLIAVCCLERAEKKPPSRREIDNLFSHHLLTAPGDASRSLQRLVQRGLLVQVMDAEAVRTFKSTDSGRSRFEDLTNPLPGKRSRKYVADEFRRMVVSVTDPSEREYLGEALDCFEMGASRAAIAMAWSAVVRNLHNQVKAPRAWQAFSQHYRREHPSNPSLTQETLKEVKDDDLISTAKRVALFDKGTEAKLLHSLHLRNACLHQSDFRPQWDEASAFIRHALEMVVPRS